MVDLTPPMRPTPPEPPQPAASLSGLEVALMVFYGAVFTMAVGSVLGIIFLLMTWHFTAYGRFIPSVDKAFVITGTMASFWLFEKIREHWRQQSVEDEKSRQEHEKELRSYEHDYGNYLDALADWPAERARRIAVEEERARAKARQLELERAERERQRLAEEAEKERARRLPIWQEAQNWALRTLNSHYFAVAAKVAVQHGDMPEADLVKVFATAYPHFECSTDWRMGCLRELAGTDARVQAVLPFLPAPDGRNTRP